MPRSPNSKSPGKDMYWFAHGGLSEDPSQSNTLSQTRTSPGPGDGEEDSSDAGSRASNKDDAGSRASNKDRASSEEPADQIDHAQQNNHHGARNKDQIFSNFVTQTSPEKPTDAPQQVARGNPPKPEMDHQAAVLEARRNAQRNITSHAFGAGVASRRIERDIAPVIPSSERERFRQPSRNVFDMTQSMTASMFSGRGRKKTDLMPTVPSGNRNGSSQKSGPKRSVSMSRLDQLAQPRKVYLEAQKAKSTISTSSAASKDAQQAPSKPATASAVHRRPKTAVARKPRPTSMHSVPDRKPPTVSRPQPTRPTSAKPPPPAAHLAAARAKSSDPAQRPHSRPTVPQRPVNPLKSTKPPPAKSTAKPKEAAPKTSQPHTLVTNKKKAAMLSTKPGPNPPPKVEKAKGVVDVSANVADDDSASSADERSSGKRIISEKEAKETLAEKRRLAREQAEKEVELKRIKDEELKVQEEERLRQEEEEQRKMEAEQLRLLEEHKQYEEEKLRKAIEEQQRKEDEEKQRKQEDARSKAEQEQKAKEEAEKQRVELEEKQRREEEERAERKKRLEKIMSRTRGKSGTASPSGSLSGSDPTDSIENQAEILSSDPDSLDSNRGSAASPILEVKPESHDSEVQRTLDLVSQSLNENDLMIPSSQDTSLDTNSMVVMPSGPSSYDSNPTAIAEDKLMDEKCDTSLDSMGTTNSDMMQSMGQKETHEDLLFGQTEPSGKDLKIQDNFDKQSVDKLPDPFTDSDALLAEENNQSTVKPNFGNVTANIEVLDATVPGQDVSSLMTTSVFQDEPFASHDNLGPKISEELFQVTESMDSSVIGKLVAGDECNMEGLQSLGLSYDSGEKASESKTELVSDISTTYKTVLDNEDSSNLKDASRLDESHNLLADLDSFGSKVDPPTLQTDVDLKMQVQQDVKDHSKESTLNWQDSFMTAADSTASFNTALETSEFDSSIPKGKEDQFQNSGLNPFAPDFTPASFAVPKHSTPSSFLCDFGSDDTLLQDNNQSSIIDSFSNPFGPMGQFNMSEQSSGFDVQDSQNFGDHIIIAPENVQVEISKDVALEKDSKATSDNLDSSFKLPRTQNPFGDFRLPPVSEEYDATHGSAVDSEDSSLDSNLSQEPVDAEDLPPVSKETVGNGHTYPDGQQLFEFQHNSSASFPRSNGYNVNNGSLYNEGFESVRFAADQSPVSYQTVEKDDISAVRSTLDNADNVNFNKASNPFAGSAESNSVQMKSKGNL